MLFDAVGLPGPANQLAFASHERDRATISVRGSSWSDVRCQNAMQFAFQHLVERAPAEAVAAVIEVANNNMLLIAANDETNALVELLRKMSRS
ncbi:hypothetical protein SAMN05216228_10614 [Rhizobium tibeticum]|uniref:Uncharacterized protein n=2 Tax=Rhizobium tibeticum TaxID=501024 RepID=A0A1H8WCH8_9HYPH|nr:hypothetical protein RTCCBAU85039_6437 [Rhizobium tibeticum]SEP25213.1 hypothetical protein SAMN05216228_10614 [Rhizobium tibeticum]